MRTIFLFLSLLAGTWLFAQTPQTTEPELTVKLDSILAEGNRLYRYEKAAWVATDLMAQNEKAFNAEDYLGFLVYEDGREVRVVLLGSESPQCIGQYTFVDDFNQPQSVRTKRRKLSDREERLLDVREKITKNISRGGYNIRIPEGYSPNVVLLPSADKYKLYILMGTSQQGVIPFGNDYLFMADSNGAIEQWHRFHSGLIPSYAQHSGMNAVESVHSHLPTTPLITATDICTFKLYAPLYLMESFSVYSPVMKKYMTYRLMENRIEVEGGRNGERLSF